MKINNHYTTPIRTQTGQNKTANPSFGAGTPLTAQSVFDKLGKWCNVDNRTGALTRWAFLVVGGVFMLGSRYFESRDKDEKREVLTRDIPGVALAAFGAPLINDAIAAHITKKSGIPIAQTVDKTSLWDSTKVIGEKSKFTTQKQIKDWYSELSKLDNPLVNFTKTISKNKGNIQKVMEKLGLQNQLKAITGATENGKIIEAIEQAQRNKTGAFSTLENSIKHLKDDNSVFQFAKKRQAQIKLGGIALTAALLGLLIPRMNIIITNNKYTDKNKAKRAAAEAAKKTESTETQKTQTVDQIQKGSFPNTANFNSKSTPQAFKSFNHFFV